MAGKYRQLVEEDFFSEDGRPLRATLDENGHEVPDPVPLAPPLGYQKQPSMIDNIRAMIRSEHLRRAAEEMGAETFDEADDLEMPEADDYEPASPYEQVFEPTPIPELRRRAAEASQPASQPAPEPAPPAPGSAPAPAPTPAPAPPKAP